MSTDFIPNFKQRTPQKNSSKDWLDFVEPQIIFSQGMRGGGKSVLVNRTAERLYNEGFLIMHIWSARSLENLYWAINKNCRAHYSKLKIIVDAFYDKTCQGNLRQKCASKGLMGTEYEKYHDLSIQSNLIKSSGNNLFKLTSLGIQLHKRELLHCNCSKSYPILIAVPDYVEFDQESIDKFNGFYFRDLKHYAKYLREITTEQKKLLEDGKLIIPKEFRSRPQIKIAHFTTPTSSDRKLKFREEFTKIILDARKEHRILVMNPSLFEGEMDKFDTLAEIFKMIPYLMIRSGHFKALTVNDVGKSRKYWSKKQKSWHRVAIVINELRSVAPSSNLHADKDASKSKKAVFGIVPEARHFKLTILGDYQDNDDLYSGVKKQANIIIIKRGSRNILGENFKWAFDKVEYDRIGLARKIWTKAKYVEKIERLKGLENANRNFKKYLDQRRPYIDELPDNKAYVTWQNQEIKLINVDPPSFHHKQSTEDFLLDTGIVWTVNKDKKPQEKSITTKKERKESIQNIKKIKEDVLIRISHMRLDGQKSWTEIKEELVELQKVGIIPQMGYENKTPVYFSNLFGEWKKKQV
jgi:hypothetical protein